MDPPGVIAVRPASGSQAWLEDEGVWTAFVLYVGDSTSGQDFRFVPSTSNPLAILPDIGSCANTGQDEASCAAARGLGVQAGTQSLGYRANESVTWEQTGTPTAFYSRGPGFTINETYGPLYYQPLDYGVDYLTIEDARSSASPITTRNKTTIFSDSTGLYYLPSLGLGSSPWIDPARDEVRYQAFIADLVLHGKIASASWGYTAGAYYKNITGSLTLGGYDRAKIAPETAETTSGIFNMTPSRAGELLLTVSNVQTRASDGTIITESFTFDAILDSTLPYLYLPRDLCNWFADAYNLTYYPLTGDASDDSGIYILDEEVASANVDRADTITFSLSSYKDDQIQAVISLDYRAFDVRPNTRWGLDASTRLFPMRRSNGQAVLGRAFFQEAYVVANFDNNTFTVAQVARTENPPQLEALGPKPPSSNGLSTGAIIGIAVGGAVLLILLALAIWWFWWRPKQRKRRPVSFEKDNVFPPVDSTRQTSIAAENERPIGGGRRYTADSTLSSNTAGFSEVEATSPTVRPGYASRISELSSDSERETHAKKLGTLLEMPVDKTDASQYEEYRSRRRSSNHAHELEGSTVYRLPG